MSVTILTIAEKAGVAPSTVSRVMTGKGRVKPATRERVKLVAEQLGYQPSAAARALITGRSASLGFIVPNITNPYFPAVIKGAQSRARGLGYSLFLGDTDEDPVLERELVRTMAIQHDGVILSPTPAATVARDVKAYSERTKIVLMNRQVAGIPAVSVDMSPGLRQTVEHLVSLGHRCIAYLGGHAASWSNQQRLRILKAEASRAQVELVLLGPYGTGYEGGAAATETVLASRATAVIAFNDLMALGMLSTLAARGVPLPDRLSVVGVDDIQMAMLSYPTLTTVRSPAHLLGQRAVDLFVREISNMASDEASEWHLPTELVVRRSTGPARTQL